LLATKRRLTAEGSTLRGRGVDAPGGSLLKQNGVQVVTSATNVEAARFIEEFGYDLVCRHGFDEDQVFGIKGQGLAADLLTGEVFLYVTLKGDPDGRPLQLVEMPFFSPAWTNQEAFAALEEQLGLSEEEATLRLKRAELFREEERGPRDRRPQDPS
jgi:hypothetical protein